MDVGSMGDEKGRSDDQLIAMHDLGDNGAGVGLEERGVGEASIDKGSPTQRLSLRFEEYSISGAHTLEIDGTTGATMTVPTVESETEAKPLLMDFEKFERYYLPEQSPEWTQLNRKARRFYLRQNGEIEGFRELRNLQVPASEDEQKKIVEEQGRVDRIVTYVSAAGNIILLISLAAAFALSGAIALVASLMDAALDNLSIILFLVITYMRRKVNRSKYPQGKERLEPVGVMIFSCIMGTASIILIVESVQKLAENPYEKPDASIIPLALVGADIAMKFCLFILCWHYSKKSGAAAALAQDHRNDIMLNSTALVCASIGSRYWAPIDPIGAILIAIYTCYSWASTAMEQVEMLTGVTASPDFLKKLTFVCCNHDKRVIAVDTVRAFRFGTRFLVEIDIVLPEPMQVREAHDIGESLQMKVERLEEVERCFVHIDYETSHHPLSEHKVWGEDVI